MDSIYPSLSLSTLARIRNGRRGAFRSSRFSVTKRVISPHVFHWMQLQNNFRTTLHLAIRTCFSIEPLMTIRNGDSAITCKGLCTVLWSIEADLTDGHLIFITGDPVSLGCWEPEKAVLMSPSPEHANLWKTEIKIPCGVHFKYNYFIKEEKQPPCDLVWRPGPEFSLAIPFLSGENEIIVVRDSWIRTRI